MVKFVLDHPVVILYLAAGWFVAAVISAMPALPESAKNKFFLVWIYNVCQIIGASLDKVGHAVQQSTAYTQLQTTLQTTDPSGMTKTEEVKATEQTATPAPGVTP